MIETIENKKGLHQIFIRFGTGDNAMQNAMTEVKDDGEDKDYTLGILSITPQEKHPIGKGSHKFHKTYEELRDNSVAFLTFKNIESVEAVQRQLEELKQSMIKGEWVDVDDV